MFTLTEAQVSLLQSHQIRVFCAACPSDPSDFAPRPLEFPQVSELHINNNKQISAQVSLMSGGICHVLTCMNSNYVGSRIHQAQYMQQTLHNGSTMPDQIKYN